MMYSTAQVRKILKITGTTIQTRINELNIVPYKLKINTNNISYFTSEQMESIRFMGVYNKQKVTSVNDGYQIYESKINKK